jgi:raffinose/stachyose/melibiose transport system permease protein
MYRKAYMGAVDLPMANAISIFIVFLSFLLIIVTKAVENRFGGRE